MFKLRRPMRPSAETPGESNLRDRCQTPAYAITPLVDDGFMRLNRRSDGHFWEPAAGDGILARALESTGRQVTRTDILTGHDFLTAAPIDCDAIVTNPPYSVGYRFLERCYQLAIPFALLMPVSLIGTKRAGGLFRAFGVRILALRQRINFKMPRLGWTGKGAHFSVAWYCWNPAIGNLAQAQQGALRQTIAWYDVDEANGLEELTWQGR